MLDSEIFIQKSGSSPFPDVRIPGEGMYSELNDVLNRFSIGKKNIESFTKTIKTSSPFAMTLVNNGLTLSGSEDENTSTAGVVLCAAGLLVLTVGTLIIATRGHKPNITHHGENRFSKHVSDQSVPQDLRYTQELNVTRDTQQTIGEFSSKN